MKTISRRSERRLGMDDRSEGGGGGDTVVTRGAKRSREDNDFLAQE